MLAKTAGVKHLVVLVNKMDDATVNWDESRYERNVKNIFFYFHITLYVCFLLTCHFISCL